MTLTLIHTSPAHCPAFEALREELAPDLGLDQQVHEVWLEQARTGMSDPLVQEITDLISALPGPVLCTCTTIGPVAEKAGATRIDWPMMQRAVRFEGPIGMAYCLRSTRQPSCALLEKALEEVGRSSRDIRSLDLCHRWSLFTDGKHQDFHYHLAADIRARIAKEGPFGAIVLAQASMAGAAALLEDLRTPVLASPKLAFQSMLDQF